MKVLSIQKSFLVSLSIHLFFIIFFSLLLITNRFQSKNEPVSISIESESESISKGLGDNIYEPIKKPAPQLKERKTKPVEKNAVTEKIAPKKENLKKELALNSKNDLQKDSSQNDNLNQIQNQISNNMAKEAENKKVKQEMDQIFGNIEQALKEGNSRTGKDGKGTLSSGDPLSDATWSSKPRKTIYFPNIQSRIPDKYKKKGMSYSITMRLSFDKNGLATKAEIISSSGDPSIDSIFNTELRKIRVEPIEIDRVDEITKVFTISLK